LPEVTADSPSEFILVQDRVVVLFWAIITVGLVSFVEGGASLAPAVSPLIISVGALLAVAGIAWVVSLWRWRLVVDSQGLELRPGFGKLRAFTFKDIATFKVARWSMAKNPMISLRDSNSKPITRIPGSCKNYSRFWNALNLERPDLAVRASGAG